MEKHLWEIEHPYFCETYNYRAAGNTCTYEYDSFDEFLEVWEAPADELEDSLDYNVIFRWDWHTKGKYDDDSDTLIIYWMLQRIGDFRVCLIKVNKEDEERVTKFLKPRWEYLKRMWNPFE